MQPHLLSGAAFPCLLLSVTKTRDRVKVVKVTRIEKVGSHFNKRDVMMYFFYYFFTSNSLVTGIKREKLFYITMNISDDLLGTI